MRRHGKGRRDERGAVMLMTVLLLTVVLTFTAFAVDLGTQRVARADMQSLADVVALDAARELDGRSVTGVQASLNAARDRAVLRNDRTVGAAPAVTVVPGVIDEQGEFQAVSGGDVPTAVQAIAATSVGFAFAPGRGDATRLAVASNGEATTCFAVSPTALALNSSGSALGPVLDQILKVNLGVLSRDGLLTLKDTVIPLADIALELGVGTPQELLALSNVSLRDFSLAAARALSANGLLAQADALNAIAAEITGGTVDVGRILKLDAGGAAGLAADINVFDLLTGAIFAANGANAINVKGLSLDVPGIGGVQELSASIVEPPQIACGKAGVVAKSAQVKIRLKSAIDPLSIGATDVKLELDLDLGRGQGTLKSLTCGASPQAVITAKSGLALLSGPSTPDGLGLLSLKVLRTLLFLPTVLSVKTQIGATAGQGGPTDLTFTQPTGDAAIPPQSVSASSNVLALETRGTKVTLLDGSLIGGLTGGLLTLLIGGILDNVVTPLVSGPVSGLLSTVLYPVLGLLGIEIGKAEIVVHGDIDCQTVKLVG